jgi:hypothetical protein
VTTRRTEAIALGIGAAAAAGYLFSRLAFVPVPWPDGSAFHLPGLELVDWPPRWRMHAQAAFVPSYDEANFNTMPALPLLLGLASRLGLGEVFGAVQATRAVSLVALVVWAWLLWRWLARAGGRRPAWLAAAVGAAALLDPVVRWGTMVVRTETWIGLCWILVLTELGRERRAAWKIAAGLAAAAYFHFEAIVLVPAVAAGLWPWGAARGTRLRAWARELWAVGARTALLLGPWLLYVALNFRLFLEQMDIQFHRLAQGNQLIGSAYALFHSLFISHGSAASWPKFLNLGKGLFWALLLVMAVASARILFGRARRSETPRARAAIAAGLVAVAASFHLWFTKPEVWFTTLIHLFVWPWAGALVLARARVGRRAVAGLAAAYAFVSLGATLVQARQAPASYSWESYRAWVDCIERAIGPGPGKRVWQPHVPDVLIELVARDPTRDVTRTLDFPGREDLAEALVSRIDALIVSRHFAADESYEGPERPRDREMLADGVEAPFGPWVRDRLSRAEWRMTVCQRGPFWAEIAARPGR